MTHSGQGGFIFDGDGKQIAQVKTWSWGVAKACSDLGLFYHGLSGDESMTPEERQAMSQPICDKVESRRYSDRWLRDKASFKAAVATGQLQQNVEPPPEVKPIKPIKPVRKFTVED